MTATAAHAQFKKGSNLLGGNFSISSQSNKNENTFEKTSSSLISFSPSFSNAYKENRFWGFDIGYGYSKTENKSSTNSISKTTVKSYSFNSFFRQYVPLGKKFYFHLQEGINLNYSKTNNTNTNPAFAFEANTYSSGLYLYPGLTYAVSKKTFFEFNLQNLVALNYSYSKTKTNGIELVNKEFRLNTNLTGFTNFSIGARFLIGKS